MGTGVIGTTGANARKTAVWAIKHGVGFAPIQRLLMAGKTALLADQMIPNQWCATIKGAQVSHRANN